MVKNLPAIQQTQETWIGSLGWEDPLEEMATHSSILAWENPNWRATVHRVVESNMTERTYTYIWLIYSAVLVSDLQQSKSAIHIYIFTLF